MMESVKIMGGGPAGLACAYFLQKEGFGVEILEAESEVGGNCRTIEMEGFRFDTGAHRFHDKVPEVTRQVRELLGEGGLVPVDVPSRIANKGGWIYFPVRPLNLLLSQAPSQMPKLLWELLVAVLKKNEKPFASFEDYARRTYGDTIAEKYLLPYTQKLWGLPCHMLSPSVAGGRLAGMKPMELLFEVLLGRKGKSRHLDGSFHYPPKGYGSVVQALSREIEGAAIRCGCRVSRLFVDGDRVTGYQLSDGSMEEVRGPVVCTLPLPLVVRMLKAHLSKEALLAAEGIRFRDLRLLFLALDRPTVSEDGSLYFSDPEIPFTRVHEPRNRSASMSPEGKTSLLVEFPHFSESEISQWGEDDLANHTIEILESLNMVNRSEVLFYHSMTLLRAYPLMEIGFEQKSETIRESMNRFRNLYLFGRSGKFVYIHLHDIFRDALGLAREIKAVSKDRSFEASSFS